MLWKGNRTKAAYTEQMYRLQHITFQQGMSLQRDLHQKLGNVKKYRPCFSFSTRKKVEIHNQRIFGTEKITHKIRTGSNSAQQKKMLSLFNGKPFCQSSLSAAQFFGGVLGGLGGAPAGRDTCGCEEGRGRGRCPRGQRCHRGDRDAAPPASGWRGHLGSCSTTHIPLPNSLPARFSESRPIAALPLPKFNVFFGRFSAGRWDQMTPPWSLPTSAAP